MKAKLIELGAAEISIYCWAENVPTSCRTNHVTPSNECFSDNYLSV